MIILWSLCFLLPKVYGHTVAVTESIEDSTYNITSLYPVSPNRTELDVQPLPTNNDEKDNKNTKLNIEPPVWKIDTAYADSKLPKDVETETKEDREETKEDRKEEIDSKEDETIERPENRTKEFKPSVHLGDYFDLDDVLPPTTPTMTITEQSDFFAPFAKKPYSGFKGYPKDHKKNPLDFPNKFGAFPYKFDSSTLSKTKDNNYLKLNSLETKLPAGGIYKYQDPFKGKPGDGAVDTDGDLIMELNGDFKETATKKRHNPWRHLLHSLTAIIPVGLIIAALTPNIITLESTEPSSPYSNRYTRSVDLPPPSPPISERCRRRLLCELYTDEHYLQSLTQPELSTNCVQYRCSDSRTLTKLLAWMFTPRTRAKKNRNILT